jgi:hypothetical protein
MTEKLKLGYFMLWQCDKQDRYITKAIRYFKNKYGYTPMEIAIGAGLIIDVPEYITESEQTIGAVQPYHIMLR